MIESSENKPVETGSIRKKGILLGTSVAAGTVAWLGGGYVGMDQAPQHNEDPNYYLLIAGATANTLGVLTLIIGGSEFLITLNRNEESNVENAESAISPSS